MFVMCKSLPLRAWRCVPAAEVTPSPKSWVLPLWGAMTMEPALCLFHRGSFSACAGVHVSWGRGRLSSRKLSTASVRKFIEEGVEVAWA